MGEEINNNKIYFKDEGGNMQEIGSTEDFNLIEVETDNIKIETFDFISKSKSFEFECKIEPENFLYSKFLFGGLKPKKFKKILMSCGFDRNQAEFINKYCIYNNIIRNRLTTLKCYDYKPLFKALAKYN